VSLYLHILIAINFVCSLVFIYLVITGYVILSPEFAKHVGVAYTGIQQNTEFADAFSYAVQLGRLDYVTCSLTILGIAIAIFGLVGFGWVTREAKESSKECTEAYLKSKEGEKLIETFARKRVEEFMNAKNDVNRLVQNIVKPEADSDTDIDSIIENMDQT
jgi:hypothetical protein